MTHLIWELFVSPQITTDLLSSCYDCVTLLISTKELCDQVRWIEIDHSCVHSPHWSIGDAITGTRTKRWNIEFTDDGASCTGASL